MKCGKTNLKNIICIDDVNDKDVLLMSDFVDNGKKLVENMNGKKFIEAKIDDNKMDTIRDNVSYIFCISHF